MTFDLFLIAVGIILLAAGGHYLVKGATSLAFLIGWSPALIGLTIIAVGTSLPEMFVGIAASLKGEPDLLLGNVLGSNILNIALVLGLGAALLPVQIRRQSLTIEWPVMFGLTLLAAFFSLDLTLGRGESAILLALTAAATVYFVFLGKAGPVAEIPEGERQELTQIQEQVQHSSRGKIIFLSLVGLLGGLVALQIGADVFVRGASSLAATLGVSPRIIGLTVVAIGTSLPELAVTLAATMKGQSDVAMGNIIGSNIFNIGAVLGIGGLIRPASFSPALLSFDFPWLIGICLILLFCCLKTAVLSRPRGALILTSYAAYLFSVFTFS